MKKNSTSTIGLSTETGVNSRRATTPRPSTVAFLRQFARAYAPAPHAAMPGIVLN
ncbi:MAG: hypothetical protein Q4C34_00575 [Bacteroidales bacterium]|nr:hypothetical protein [Bacteroidales bacterium]